MPDSITCGRCGMTSRNPDDIAAYYCGHCHAPAAPWARPAVTADASRLSGFVQWAPDPPLPWSRPDADIRGDIAQAADYARQRYLDSYLGFRPAAPPPPEIDLTPEVLLTDGRWVFEGFSGDEAVFRFSPFSGPLVSSWRPHASLGRWTADWSGGDTVEVRLARGVIERAAVDLVGQVPVRRLMQPACAALIRVLTALHPLVRVLDEPADWYCPACGRSLTVPAGVVLVLCDRHDEPQRMLRPALGSQLAVEPSGEPGFFQSEGWRVQMDERIAASVLSGPPSLAGLSVSAEGLAELEAEERQIRAGSARTAREEMPPRPATSRTRRLRNRQALMDRTEELLRRLDGEGYGIRDKANQVDAETVSIPELPMADHDSGGNAARWQPGDPIV